MQFYLRYSAFVFVLVFSGYPLFAQSLSSYGNPVISNIPEKNSVKASIGGTWEAGVMLGPDFYYGDLNSKKFLPSLSTSAAGGIFITRQFTNVIGLKGQLLFGGIRGNKDGTESNKPVNWNFTGIFLDFTVNSVFNFSNIISPYREGRKIFVYGTLGLGINAWNSQLTKGTNGVLTNPTQLNGFQAGLVLPLGLGLQYAITNKISAGVEYTVRMIFSDYVDQTPGGFKNDFVNYLAFSASYRFGTLKKKINVQEYTYTNPVWYQPVIPEPPIISGSEIQGSFPIASESDGYCYVVQVCAYSKHNYSVAWVKKHYHIDMPVVKEVEKDLNRFIIGLYYKDLSLAKELCDKLRKQGIQDAWVIAYKNGVRHHEVVY